MRTREIEKAVAAVWSAHAVPHGTKRCVCGYPVEDLEDADFHFGVEVYKAGIRAGRKTGRGAASRLGRGRKPDADAAGGETGQRTHDEDER